MKRPDPSRPPQTGDTRLTRAVRIALIAVVVYAVEWRLVAPEVVAADPNLRPMPWAILALLGPVALGVWTFEIASRDPPGAKADALWGVLAASLAYVVTLIVQR